MVEESAEPSLIGQVAGIIAMISALVKTLPPATRVRLQRQIHAEFESLLSAMSATSGEDAQAERNSVEWMRDLFLKKIEELNPNQKAKGARIAKGSIRKPVLENQHPVVEPGASKDVDFEL